jgi:hypothetical protein
MARNSLIRSAITGLVVLGVMVAPAGAAAGTASIGGTVTSADTEAPLARVRVVAGRLDGPGTNEARTDAEGKYTIGGLEAGEYELAFYPPEGANYVPQKYGSYDEGDSESITLADGQAVTWGNASMTPGSTISGRVTDKSGGAAAKICVAALRFEGTTGTIRTLGASTTDSSGNYAISSLGSGYYKMWFGPWEGTFGACAGGGRNTGYVEQWLDRKPDFFTSLPINVGYKKELSGIDAQLDRWTGSAAATQTGGDSGTPASGPGAKCVVPKLRGMAPKPARKALKRAGCKAGKQTQRAHDKVKRGRVIGTKPKAGTELPAGTAVDLVVSKGRARGQ